MDFLNKFFEKDIKFLKSLNNSKKKKLVYFFFFLIIFIIFFIKKERFIIFLILLSILLIWKILMEIFLYVIIKNEKLKMFIRKNESNFEIILKILLFIQKWKNPFLVFFLYFDKLLFKIVRNLVYKVKVEYKYKLTDLQLEKVFFVYYFIINLMFGPFKLMFGFIYRIMNHMKGFPFSLFFIIRIIVFVLSVLIFSDLYHSLYNKCGPFYLFIFVYFFFIFINCMIKYIGRDFEYFKIQYINNFINTDYLIYLRNNSTFCGISIISISIYKFFLIDRKYIDITSSCLKLELDEGFYKYWEYYKKDTWFDTTNIWREIKNRPSWYIYINILVWMKLPSMTVRYGPSAITNIIFFLIKIEKLNLKLTEDIKKDLDFLYTFFLLRLKLLLFIVYDINNYIGNDNCNYITYKYEKWWKIYEIESDYNIFDFFDVDNFKIEENKNDLPFYNLDKNIEFFDRLYLLIGIVPVNENPLELPVYSPYSKKVKDLVDNMSARLSRLNRLTEWNRGWHFYISSKEEEDKLLVEKEVKNWIDLFLKETREDWYFGLEKENIEERNWRLLKEIEDLFI